MQTTETVAVFELFVKAKQLSSAARIDLAQQILSSLKAPDDDRSAPRVGPSAAEIRAKYRTDKPAPDDATVKQWIDEHRMEKYGS